MGAGAGGGIAETTLPTALLLDPKACPQLFFSSLFSSSSYLLVRLEKFSTAESLLAGQYLEYGEAHGFIMQDDYNLVLYEYRTPIWASNTDGRGQNCRCTMQDDENLVVYNSNGQAVWVTGTDRNRGNYVLVLHKERNVVIYGGALWASGTSNGLEGITVTTNKGLSAKSSS